MTTRSAIAMRNGAREHRSFKTATTQTEARHVPAIIDITVVDRALTASTDRPVH